MEQSVNYRRIIIPVTGAIEDRKILALAKELGAHHDLTIILVFVVVVPQALPLDADLPEDIDRGEEVLARAERLASDLIDTQNERVTTDLLQARSVGAAIVDEAIEQGADAIMMASRVRIIHGRPTTGVTADYVVVHAPCDVLILRASPDYVSKGA